VIRSGAGLGARIREASDAPYFKLDIPQLATWKFLLVLANLISVDLLMN
jgi:hypothetical protein